MVEVAQSEGLLATATSRRATADNGINVTSSRSHLLMVYQLHGGSGGSKRCGQIALVDLAGSERLARTEATGERRGAAVAINKSLSALGEARAG